jgi:short-subunit dehydrogenase
MSNFFNNKVVAVTVVVKALAKLWSKHSCKEAQKWRHAAVIMTNYTFTHRLRFISFTYHVTDVSNENDCRRFIESTIKVFGGIDILINNAGISMRAELKDASVDVIRKVMEINFFGAVYCTHFALNSIIERKGIIVGVSSIAGYRGLPGRSGYSASKFALQGWLEAIRTELIDSGVHVMWVCPGFTTSNIRNAALNNKGESQGESPLDESKLMSAEECARIILNAIEKRKRTVVMTFTGKRTVLLNKFFPGFTDKMTRKFFYNKGTLVK